MPAGLAASGAILRPDPAGLRRQLGLRPRAARRRPDAAHRALPRRASVRAGARRSGSSAPFMGFGVFVMMQRQMLGIRDRARADGGRAAGWRSSTRRQPVAPSKANVRTPDRRRVETEVVARVELTGRPPARPARVVRGGLDAVGLPSMATDTSPRVPLAERVLAERVRVVPPSGIRRFFDIAATMDDVISLGVGEPDFDTPRVIVEAGVESLREGRTHYTSNFGTLELRRALARHLEARYGVRYDPATELMITVGASEAVDLALRATCDPGDEVILHEPSYVAYVPAIVFAGGVGPPRRDPIRGRLRARSGGRRGRHHAADQGAVPRLSVQPDRRRAARRGRGRDRRHRRPPRPARLQRRDLRPARLRDLSPPDR